MKVIIIAGVASNGVIGKGNELPWHISEDLKHFRKLTTGKPVIMGSKTYESIVDRLGKPLPDRKSIVLTYDKLNAPEDVITVGDIEAALREAKKYGKEIYVIGGASVYGQFLSVADALELTKIHRDFEGNVFFPEVNWDEWEKTREKNGETAQGLKYSFVTYERKKNE